MNTKLDNHLMHRLKALRLQHGYSQNDVAERLHISRQAISKWENGKSYPDLDNLRLLSELYNTSLDSFFNEETAQLRKVKNPLSITLVLLFLASILSYYVSPFGVILIPIILFFARKRTGYKWMIYTICVIALWKNGTDIYYLVNSNPENEVITVEEVDE
ncbi:helix-turn-helix domain-containing protein [Kurthia senegalensis]|uniref:helix-turn-helix domain-containing protein n=1 Tax=Kurthia senegalensis TaxID=1033740 RepID=UPI000287ABCA|nr:helix-turn-helix transcriptional regulator [Kurthia senegalensis]